MIKKDNARHISTQAQQLMALAPSNRTRDAILYFFGNEVFDGGYLTAAVVEIEDGYTPAQSSALLEHAREVHDDIAATSIPEFMFAGGSPYSPSIVRFDLCGRVSLRFGLTKALLWLSNEELMEALALVRLVADKVHALAMPGNAALRQTPDYFPHAGKPLGFPETSLWCIKGVDTRSPHRDVVDWAADEEDAAARVARMRAFPKRFLNLTAEPYVPAEELCEA